MYFGLAKIRWYLQELHLMFLGPFSDLLLSITRFLLFRLHSLLWLPVLLFFWLHLTAQLHCCYVHHVFSDLFLYLGVDKLSNTLKRNVNVHFHFSLHD